MCPINKLWNKISYIYAQKYISINFCSIILLVCQGTSANDHKMLPKVVQNKRAESFLFLHHRIPEIGCISFPFWESGTAANDLSLLTSTSVFQTKKENFSNISQQLSLELHKPICMKKDISTYTSIYSFCIISI